MQQLKTVLKELEAPMLETLRRWIMTPSVKSDAAEHAPFGKDVAAMLDLALDDCKSMGFETKNVDYYAGHADMGEGKAEDALGILAHLDVVPVGDGWTKKPFGAEVENGLLFGRGTSDDKGPAVAALYAMYAVKKAGIPLKRKVRLILGCDEESGWECMKYYRSHETMPKSGFTPDADYPVINIEKGQLGIRLNAKQSSEGLKVLSWHAGERTNVIPGFASVVVENQEGLQDKVAKVAQKIGYALEAKESEEGLVISAKGIPGHAAYPEKALNAIGVVLLALKELGVKGALRQLADCIGVEHSGKSLGIEMSDVQSGKLTLNLGIIRVKDGEVFATLDLRCPILANLDALVRVIERNLDQFDVSLHSRTEPHYVPENSELVQELLNAYHEETGLPKQALAIGGGTYAKVLEEGVAFGMSFPGDVEVAHQADEHIKIENLVKSMHIFANAIVRLAGAK